MGCRCPGRASAAVKYMTVANLENPQARKARIAQRGEKSGAGITGLRKVV